MSNFSPTILNKMALIPAHEFLAVRERYKGTPYKIICEKIYQEYGVVVNEHTVRWWFCKSGRLKEFYRDYADEMVRLEAEETLDFIKGNLKEAGRTLAKVMMGQGGPAQVMAAREFLDRGLGKVKEEMDINQKIMHFTLKDFIQMQYGTGDGSDHDAGGKKDDPDMAE